MLKFSVSRKAVGWTVWKEGRRDCAVCRVAPSSALFGRWKFWKPQACFANANLDDHSSTNELRLCPDHVLIIELSIRISFASRSFKPITLLTGICLPPRRLPRSALKKECRQLCLNYQAPYIARAIHSTSLASFNSHSGSKSLTCWTPARNADADAGRSLAH